MKKIPILLITSILCTIYVSYGSSAHTNLDSNTDNNMTLVTDNKDNKNNKMIYPIYVYGSTVLRETAIEIDKDYPNLGELIENMFATMYESEGVGIAGPQIGKGIRIFTVDVPLAVEEGQEPNSFIKVFINPKIYGYSDSMCSMVEGCLSLPGMSEEVVRSNSIRIKYCDENFVEYDQEFSGFIARVIQHEYDHLEGIVYTDRVVPELKAILEDELKAMSDGNFNAEYKTKQENVNLDQEK